MPQSRSSIFSFETLRLDGWPPDGFLRAVGLAVLLVVCAEGAAWLALPGVDRRRMYWKGTAATKFETYLDRARAGDAPGLLVVGDSTAARDLAPEALAADGDGYSLAWPGNFPMAFRCSTLPVLRREPGVPRLVVASFSPNGFVGTDRVKQSEAGIVGSEFCRRAGGETVPSDYLALLRLQQRLVSGASVDEDDEEDLDVAPDRLGFMPLAGKSEKAARRANRNQSEKDEVRSIEAERFEVIRELASIARERGFALVVVVPPVAPKEHDGNVYREYVAALDEASREFGFTVLDLRHPPNLARENFYDSVHLNEEGALVFSRDVAAAIAAR